MAINCMLITKEFSVLKKQILCYTALSVIAIAIMALPSRSAALFGSILQCTVMISFYCHITMKSVISEVKDKHHALWLGLPITSSRLQLTKLLSLWIVFFALWLPSLVLTFLVILSNPNWPAVAIAFYVFGFSLYLPAFALILTAAFTTRSEGVTIFILVTTNLAVTILLNLIPKADAISQAFAAGTIAQSGLIWPPLLLKLAGAAITTCITLMLLAAFKLSRKQECYV